MVSFPEFDAFFHDPTTRTPCSSQAPNDLQHVSVSSVPVPSQPPFVCLSVLLQPSSAAIPLEIDDRLPNVSQASVLPSTSQSIHSHLSLSTSQAFEAPSNVRANAHTEFDNSSTNLGADNARDQLPLRAQLANNKTRSTSGIVVNTFPAKRKRKLSIPHHVVRNLHALNIALPTDEPIESFIAKRRRIDTIHVMTRCHPTDAPT